MGFLPAGKTVSSAEITMEQRSFDHQTARKNSSFASNAKSSVTFILDNHTRRTRSSPDDALGRANMASVANTTRDAVPMLRGKTKPRDGRLAKTQSRIANSGSVFFLRVSAPFAGERLTKIQTLVKYQSILSPVVLVRYCVGAIRQRRWSPQGFFFLSSRAAVSGRIHVRLAEEESGL